MDLMRWKISGKVDNILSKTQQNVYYTVQRDTLFSNSMRNTLQVSYINKTQQDVVSIQPFKRNTTTLSLDNWFWIFNVNKYFIILIFTATTLCIIIRSSSYYKKLQTILGLLYIGGKKIITDFSHSDKKWRLWTNLCTRIWRFIVQNVVRRTIQEPQNK